MARSVSPSLTSRFTQLVGAPGDAAHQGLLDDLARQPGLASALLQVALGAPAEARARAWRCCTHTSPAPRSATVRSSRSTSYRPSIARPRMD